MLSSPTRSCIANSETTQPQRRKAGGLRLKGGVSTYIRALRRGTSTWCSTQVWGAAREVRLPNWILASGCAVGGMVGWRCGFVEEVGGELSAVGQAEVCQDVVDVAFDGSFGQDQAVGDFAVGQGFRDEVGHLPFARG